MSVETILSACMYWHRHPYTWVHWLLVDNKLETWARGRQQADEYQPLVHFVLKPLALVIKFTCLPCLTLASVARHLVTTDHNKRGNRVWYLVLVDIVCTKRPNNVMSSQPPYPPPHPTHFAFSKHENSPSIINCNGFCGKENQCTSHYPDPWPLCLLSPKAKHFATVLVMMVAAVMLLFQWRALHARVQPPRSPGLLLSWPRGKRSRKSPSHQVGLGINIFAPTPFGGSAHCSTVVYVNAVCGGFLLIQYVGTGFVTIWDAVTSVHLVKDHPCEREREREKTLKFVRTLLFIFPGEETSCRETPSVLRWLFFSAVKVYIQVGLSPGFTVLTWSAKSVTHIRL